MLLCIGFPWSWSCLCLAVVVYRILPVLVLPLMGYCSAQASPHLGIDFAGLWFWSGFPQSWSGLCWAVFMHRLASVFAFAGLWICSGFPGLDLAFTGLWLWTGFPRLCLTFAGLWFCSGFPRSWPWLGLAVVVNRFPLFLILHLLGCGCE